MRIFVFIASAKIPEREGSISACSFYGELPISHTYFVLPTKWMSSPSRK